MLGWTSLLGYYSLPQHYILNLHIQARSQKFIMGGGGLFGESGGGAAGGSGFGGKAPSRRRHGGLGAEPSALENFAFFCKNNFILGLF